MKLARAVQDLAPSGIRRFFDVVSRMDDVISLGVGEPDFGTAWRVREAAIYGLERGRTSYTGNAGLLELRQAIAAALGRRYGLEYDPEEQVLVTVGVSEALDLALRALLDPGDEVIVPEPCYVAYPPCVTLAGGVPVPLPTRAEQGFVPTPEEVERLITPRTRAILLNYPNNPTGGAPTREQLLALAEVARRRDLVVISDEIYDRLSYDRPHVSVPTLPGMAERTLLLNGFSKTYGMTGWRVGYAAGPADLVAAMTKIHQYTALCAGRSAQEAAIEALRVPDRDVEAMVDDYDARRRLIVAGLNRIGLPCHLPAGAFYAFPSVAATGLSAQEFAERLLHEGRVAVVPGDAFGAGGAGHVRCAYATGLDQIEEALGRMERFVVGLPTMEGARIGTTVAS
ncbi:MAG: Aspartate aminotransferase [uncultured Thermomicrobiales bacterium]|uniref:Aminotransferase n=1 Tax=uncultured Thermomicrobiales bacterium TaxID=1645740 RepID=A0A6J4UML7_9BACT|nr:MAG: Aspartate aminotransferase [uncultured Thermomicrobiales bacterium]